jgi:hypothetical protein
MPASNSNYPKVTVQLLNKALNFYKHVCLVDSEVLRNRHLRVAVKRNISYKLYISIESNIILVYNNYKHISIQRPFFRIQNGEPLS